MERTAFRIPALLWAGSLVAVPLFYVLVLSFLKRGINGGVEAELTLENYQLLFEGSRGTIFLWAIGRSLFIAALTTILCLLMAFPLVLFLVFRAGALRGPLLFLLIVPFWTNFLLRTYALFALLSDSGVINRIVMNLGFESGVSLLFTPTAVILGMVYNYLPYMALSLYVSVDRIDPLLLEASSDLGAGTLRRFFKVVVPLCIPGMFAGSVMVFVPAAGDFVIPELLGGGTRLTLGGLLVQQFLSARHWPYGSVLTIVLLILFFGAVASSRKFRALYLEKASF